ncbi:MAG: quinone-dependent dihydroorotate dehydrogenase [Gammaproteobacteria bacterium]|nr:quinone-dependent dihydroorotate dehydrogenase [Gammaproteobacteria bacterium]
MSGYNLIRPLIFRLDPEFTHQQTIAFLQRASNKPSRVARLTKRYRKKIPKLPIELFGKKLSSPVGLAAGFDKNGVAFPALFALGFGFVEVGTVTPRAQPGNPKVRVFRLDQEESIINRLGFNNNGLEAMLGNLSTYSSSIRPGILGINIGKNTDTPIERAIEDYLACLGAIYEYADYAVLNLSSPNSPGLRLLQQESEFNELVHAVMEKRDELASKQNDKLLPVAVKISPDLEPEQIDAVAELSLKHRVDALIATNTTIARTAPVLHKHFTQSGGLSGKLLADQATAVISRLASTTRGQIPIIGVGGIGSAEDAWKKLLAGATALQLYTAMVFQGPVLLRQIVTGLAERARHYDERNFSAALEQARSQL